MSVFSVTSQGVITVDTSTIRSDFEEAYKGALGADLNLDASTPQGQLVVNDTAVLTGAMGEVVNIANSFSVYYATGPALDVAAAFFGYYRKQGIGTVVSAVLTGTAGTVIPAGSLVGDGTLEYALLDDVIILQGQTTTAQFQCTTPGANPCPAGSLTTIITTVSGWDTVNNPSDGVQGYETENDNEFRYRITANWLNVRARSILGAIIDNVAALDEVVSVIGRENYGDSQIEIDGIILSPHSVYLCVLGGRGEAIAGILAGQKTLGAGVNGNTDVTYYDSEVDYKYTYKIERPTVVDLSVQVQYSKNNFTPSNVEEQIKQLILAWIAANPFKIGQTISGNVVAQSLNGFNQVNLLSFKVRVGASGSFVDYITTTISQVAVLSAQNIMVEEIS